MPLNVVRDLRGLGPGTYSTFGGQTQRLGAGPPGGTRAAPSVGAAPSGGGFAGGGQFQDIIKQMQAAQEKANLLNKQRYRQILGQFEGLGTAGRARIEQQTTQRQAETTQSLTSRGLGNTTITAAASRGIASDAELQRQQLDESVAMQKAGVMERRSDVGPDLSMFANLLQSASQGQAAAGGMRSSFQIGPMAKAGRSIFGTPFRYGSGSRNPVQTQQPRASFAEPRG